MSLSDELGDRAPPRHVPVMVREVIEYLAPQVGQTVVDATVGAGGHACEIARRLGSNGLLICIDRDPRMLEIARRRVTGTKTAWFEANYADLRTILNGLNVHRVDGVLLDLGIASDQIEDAQRGFSFLRTGPLDMRMNPMIGESAHTLVNTRTAQELADIFYRYGEERHSRRIARAIVEERRRQEIATTEALAQVVRRALPRGRSRHRIDPATRVFQALRIAVNHELTALEQGLQVLPECLKPRGRAVVISFHSLEDRLVKQSFRQRDLWELLTRKPRTPDEAEIAQNPRARSAKLRAARFKGSGFAVQSSEKSHGRIEGFGFSVQHSPLGCVFVNLSICGNAQLNPDSFLGTEAEKCHAMPRLVW